jgi:hypothetical protein
VSDAVIDSRVESFRVRRSPHKTSMKAWLGTALVLSLFGGGVIRLFCRQGSGFPATAFDCCRECSGRAQH